MRAIAAMPSDLAAALNGIDVVLLLGGPMGSGKTTYANQLMEGSERSSFLDGYRGRLSRTDAKSLPRKRFMPGGLVVEFATNRLNEAEQIHSTRDYIQALQHRVNVVGAHTFEVSGWPLFRRYLKRMRGLQFLHFGKLKTIANYAQAGATDEGVANWKTLLAQCGIENRTLSGRA